MTLFFSFVHTPECAYCSIGKLVNCEFICLLFFNFVHAVVCANCKVILIILIQKKKNKKKQKDPYLGMGKNTKVMPQNAPLSIFSLGKGGEYLHLKPYEKLSAQVHFLTCPQHALN